MVYANLFESSLNPYVNVVRVQGGSYAQRIAKLNQVFGANNAYETLQFAGNEIFGYSSKDGGELPQNLVFSRANLLAAAQNQGHSYQLAPVAIHPVLYLHV